MEVRQLHFKGMKHLGEIWHCQETIWDCFVIHIKFTPESNLFLWKWEPWQARSHHASTAQSKRTFLPLKACKLRWAQMKCNTQGVSSGLPLKNTKPTNPLLPKTLIFTNRTISYFIWPCFWWSSLLWSNNRWKWSFKIKLQEIKRSEVAQYWNSQDCTSESFIITSEFKLSITWHCFGYFYIFYSHTKHILQLDFFLYTAS